jgi:hypothetical protein
MAFLGHLGLNIVQKSKEKVKDPLNAARPCARAYIACPGPRGPLAGAYFQVGIRGDFSTIRSGSGPPTGSETTQEGHRRSWQNELARSSSSAAASPRSPKGPICFGVSLRSKPRLRRLQGLRPFYRALFCT